MAMQRRLVRLARGIVVLSDFSRNELLDLAPATQNKIVKIPGGIEPGIFFPADAPDVRPKYGIENDAPILFTARRLVRRVGIDILFEALALLNGGGLKLNLIVAGQGPMRARLESEAVKLGIKDSVRFVGFVSDADLADLYRGCDIFVLPTREQENFGLPVLEAAACGCPVVATPVGSLPEVMSAVGSPYLCERADARAIASAVERVLDDASRAARSSGERAKSVLQKYSWDAVAQSHLEHYEKVIACASR